MKIYILNDNNCKNDNFLCEHGLSFLVKDKDFTFLFDAGQSDVFIKNANTLNVNLNDIDFIVLSHGDYDHGDGLKYLKLNKKVPLYVHPDAFTYRISKRRGCYAGLNQNKEEIEENFILNESVTPKEIYKTVYFLGEIERQESFHIGGLPMIDKAGNEYLHKDDTGVAIKTEKGLFIITGCGHSGLCNIIEHAKKVTKTDKVYAILGGFHLKENNEKTTEVLTYLKTLGAKKLLLAHCTSNSVCELFKLEFNNVATRIETGKIYEI